MNLQELVESHRIVVCVGSGGVGKTTTAAAIALSGARAGRRAMVLTIDPARRLAQSLGVSELAAGGEKIAATVFDAAGIEVTGSLSAGMLDQKSAWDQFIARHAPSEKARDTVLENQFYQHLSRSFAGSTEYMAIEELGRIHESGEFDLIVLDTPPSAHALDFLDAPQKLEDFLDRSSIASFIKPYASMGWGAWKTASRTARFLFERVERATGIEALNQISDFFIAMESMFDGITERSRNVRALLKADFTAFVLVAGTEEQVLGESESLTTKMIDLEMPLKGVVMNRVHPLPGSDPELDDEQASTIVAALTEEGLAPDAAGWLVANYRAAAMVSNSEAVRLETFEEGLTKDVTVVTVPEMNGDVHDLVRLADVGKYLVGEGAA